MLPSIHVLFSDSGTPEFDRNSIFAGVSALSKGVFHDLGRNVLEQAPLLEFLGVLSATTGILTRELSASAIAEVRYHPSHQEYLPSVERVLQSHDLHDFFELPFILNIQLLDARPKPVPFLSINPT
jgi:hypothetical protein